MTTARPRAVCWRMCTHATFQATDSVFEGGRAHSEGRLLVCCAPGLAERNEGPIRVPGQLPQSLKFGSGVCGLKQKAHARQPGDWVEDEQRDTPGSLSRRSTPTIVDTPASYSFRTQCRPMPPAAPCTTALAPNPAEDRLRRWTAVAALLAALQLPAGGQRSRRMVERWRVVTVQCGSRHHRRRRCRSGRYGASRATLLQRPSLIATSTAAPIRSARC